MSVALRESESEAAVLDSGDELDKDDEDKEENDDAVESVGS